MVYNLPLYEITLRVLKNTFGVLIVTFGVLKVPYLAAHLIHYPLLKTETLCIYYFPRQHFFGIFPAISFLVSEIIFNFAPSLLLKFLA